MAGDKRGRFAPTLIGELSSKLLHHLERLRSAAPIKTLEQKSP